MQYLVIAFSFGLATAIIARAKGSSFFIWLLIGSVLPVIGLVAVLLYRSEKAEPERICPTCNKVLKLYVQVCPRCGTDLYLPDQAEVRHPSG
jgi:hypothetical protein